MCQEKTHNNNFWDGTRTSLDKQIPFLTGDGDVVGGYGILFVIATKKTCLWTLCFSRFLTPTWERKFNTLQSGKNQFWVWSFVLVERLRRDGQTPSCPRSWRGSCERRDEGKPLLLYPPCPVLVSVDVDSGPRGLTVEGVTWWSRNILRGASCNLSYDRTVF